MGPERFAVLELARHRIFGGRNQTGGCSRKWFAVHIDERRRDMDFERGDDWPVVFGRIFGGWQNPGGGGFRGPWWSESRSDLYLDERRRGLAHECTHGTLGSG